MKECLLCVPAIMHCHTIIHAAHTLPRACYDVSNVSISAELFLHRYELVATVPNKPQAVQQKAMTGASFPILPLPLFFSFIKSTFHKAN